MPLRLLPIPCLFPRSTDLEPLSSLPPSVSSTMGSVAAVVGVASLLSHLLCQCAYFSSWFASSLLHAPSCESTTLYLVTLSLVPCASFACRSLTTPFLPPRAHLARGLFFFSSLLLQHSSTACFVPLVPPARQRLQQQVCVWHLLTIFTGSADLGEHRGLDHRPLDSASAALIGFGPSYIFSIETTRRHLRLRRRRPLPDRSGQVRAN